MSEQVSFEQREGFFSKNKKPKIYLMYWKGSGQKSRGVSNFSKSLGCLGCLECLGKPLKTMSPYIDIYQYTSSAPF